MLSFGIAGIVASNLEERKSEYGAKAAIVFSSTVLMCVIIFSEMLPRRRGTVAQKIALAVAIPMSLAVRLVSASLAIDRCSEHRRAEVAVASFCTRT